MKARQFLDALRSSLGTRGGKSQDRLRNRRATTSPEQRSSNLWRRAESSSRPPECKRNARCSRGESLDTRTLRGAAANAERREKAEAERHRREAETAAARARRAREREEAAKEEARKKRESAERLFERSRGAKIAAEAENEKLRSFLAFCGIEEKYGPFLEWGIESLEVLSDHEIVSDCVLRDELGLNAVEVAVVRSQLRKRAEADAQRRAQQAENERKKNKPDGAPSLGQASDRKRQFAESKGRALTVLGLQPSASRAEVKKTYRALVLKWHPDKMDRSSSAGDRKSVEMFMKIHQAYEAYTSIVAAESREQEQASAEANAAAENARWAEGVAEALFAKQNKEKAARAEAARQEREREVAAAKEEAIKRAWSEAVSKRIDEEVRKKIENILLPDNPLGLWLGLDGDDGQNDVINLKVAQASSQCTPFNTPVKLDLSSASEDEGYFTPESSAESRARRQSEPRPMTSTPKFYTPTGPTPNSAGPGSRNRSLQRTRLDWADGHVGTLVGL